MSSIKSYRPQNLDPQGLIQARKDVAQKNEHAVRIAVQAIRQRKTPPSEVTVQLVAREAGVSAATIYRRNELFALVRRVNPKLQRHQAEQISQSNFLRAEAELADAKREIEDYKNQAALAKLESEKLQQKIAQLRKEQLDLARQIAQLKEDQATCTCKNKKLQSL